MAASIGNTRYTVIKIRKIEPNIPAIRLAKLLGVSKARIGKILENENLPTKIKRNLKFMNCKHCDMPTNKKFCSQKCKNSYKHVFVNCTNCNVEKSIAKNYYLKLISKGGKTFCTRKCRHVWYWKNFPERMSKKRILDKVTLGENVNN